MERDVVSMPTQITKSRHVRQVALSKRVARFCPRVQKMMVIDAPHYRDWAGQAGMSIE